MKQSYPWGFRRILKKETIKSGETGSPFTQAIADCVAEREKAVRFLWGACITVTAIFALIFVLLGRFTVPSDETLTPVEPNPASEEAMRARAEALKSENALLGSELKKAQRAVDDLQDLVERRASEFREPENNATPVETDEEAPLKPFQNDAQPLIDATESTSTAPPHPSGE